MSNVVLSPAAKSDLITIWDYTANRWGYEQAENYIRSIQKACDGLAENPSMGIAADEVRRGYRRVIVGSHLLFYRTDEPDLVDVVRILHQRMDVTRHL